MELKQYAQMLWRWAWLIVLATVLAGGAAYVVSINQIPVFQASTAILIDQAPDARNSDFTALLLAERLTDTYAELLVKRPVLDDVIAALGLDLSAPSLRSAIEVIPVRETQIIEVKVEHENPFLAADLANKLVSVFSAQNATMQENRFSASKDSLEVQLAKLELSIASLEEDVREFGPASSQEKISELDRLQTELGQFQNSYTRLLQSYEALRLQEALSVSNIVQIEVAEPVTTPIRPRTRMNTLLAAIVGAMLAVGVVFLIEYLDDTIKSTDEVAARLKIPVIGFIMHAANGSEEMPFVFQEPRSPIAEAFRSLRSNINFASVDSPIQTILVTSPSPEDGKSTVAANLAVVMAQSKKRVLLMDADLRRPRLHRIMGVSNKLGFSDFFVKKTKNLESVIHHIAEMDLSVVTSGKLPPNPAELLNSERMAEVLEMLKGKYDAIVIDSPPVGVVTDPVILAAIADATILVVEPKSTQLRAAVQTVEQLRRADAQLIGMVFNNVPRKRATYYAGYESGYYYRDAYYGEDGQNGANNNVGGKKRKKKERKGAMKQGSKGAGEA